MRRPPGQLQAPIGGADSGFFRDCPDIDHGVPHFRELRNSTRPCTDVVLRLSDFRFFMRINLYLRTVISGPPNAYELLCRTHTQRLKSHGFTGPRVITGFIAGVTTAEGYPEARKLEPETRHPTPDTRIPTPNNRHMHPETRTRTPKSEGPNP